METIIEAFTWYFIDIPKKIIEAWKSFLFFNFSYFSLTSLLKTFFSHWHKYRSFYGKTIDFKIYIEAFIFNSMSRIIGVILRSVFIVVGLATEILIVIAGFIVLMGWLLVPFFILWLLSLGIRLLF